MDTQMNTRNAANIASDDARTQSELINAIQSLDVAIVLLDKDLKFIFGNRLWREIFFPDTAPPSGSSANDMLRRQLGAGFYRLPEGETADGFLARFFASIRSYTKDLEVELSTGHVLNAASFSTGPGGYLISFRDISTEIRSQQEADRQRIKTERANVRLRDALESIGEAFALFDHQDRLILANDLYKSANPAAAHLMTFGRPRSDIIEAMANGGDIIGVDDWVGSYDREVTAGDTSSPRRYEVHHSDGRVFGGFNRSSQHLRSYPV